MGRKVHPVIFRINQVTKWKSRWFNKKKYQSYLKQDVKLRDFLMKKLNKAGVNDVEIDRAAHSVVITIYAARPGLIIGRGGAGSEELKKETQKILKKEGLQDKTEIKIQIEQLLNPESQARVVAVNIAEQLEKRIGHRRVLKQTLSKVIQAKDVQGVKIKIKGRLGGAEIARQEWLQEGKLPLQTIRANIDYGEATAYTTYGTVGVKVWIYKGEKF